MTLLVLAVTVIPWYGCKSQRDRSDNTIRDEVTPTSRPDQRILRPLERRQEPGGIFGFELGMSRRQVLAAMRPRFRPDRFNTPSDQIRASGKMLGKDAGARFYFQAGKLVRFTLSPQVTGPEIAGRNIGQSAIYRAVVKELGSQGQFLGGPAAQEAQFGEATWRRGAVMVVFSLDGGHHDRSGESFVQASITVQGRGEPSGGK